MHEEDSVSAKALGKSLFLCQNDWSGQPFPAIFLESTFSELFSLRMTIAWILACSARKLEKLLTQQENLLVPGHQMGNFFEPGGVTFCKFSISKFLMVIKHVYVVGNFLYPNEVETKEK